MQDTKQVLAQLREAKFAGEEQREKVAGLQAELAGSRQQVQAGEQSRREVQAELEAQAKQQQHLLDELSQSQVCPITDCFVPCAHSAPALLPAAAVLFACSTSSAGILSLLLICSTCKSVHASPSDCLTCCSSGH